MYVVKAGGFGRGHKTEKDTDMGGHEHRDGYGHSHGQLLVDPMSCCYRVSSNVPIKWCFSLSS
jgi:hypothetical protein